MKQPVLGIVATIIVMAVSLALISFFDFPTFAGWVSYSLMCLIPMQIVVGVTWGTNQPSFAAKQRDRSDRPAGFAGCRRRKCDAAGSDAHACDNHFGCRDVLGCDHLRRLALQGSHQE